MFERAHGVTSVGSPEGSHLLTPPTGEGHGPGPAASGKRPGAGRGLQAGEDDGVGWGQVPE